MLLASFRRNNITLCTRFNRAPAVISEASIHPITITSKIIKKTWSKRKYWNLQSIWGGRYSIKVRLQLSRKQDSYLADQSTTVLRCIWECSSQILVRRATEHPLRPKIGTARLAQNIPNPHCIVTQVCARVLPHAYFASYIVNDVSSRLPYIFVVVKAKPLGAVGSVSWEMQNGGKHNKYLMFLCTCE